MKGNSKASVSTVWRPRVRFYTELQKWGPSGPLDVMPGHWIDEQNQAFLKWLKTLTQRETPVIGRFFVRNGKVWGVEGPSTVNAPSGPEGTSTCVATLQLPAYWRGEVLLDRFWLDGEGNLVQEDSEFSRWKVAAEDAIKAWNQKVPWEPEIGHLKDKSAWGVVPPTDVKPKNWRQRAEVIWQEWLRMEQMQERLDDAEDTDIAAQEELEDGLGWLSPRHDAYFESIGVSTEQRKLWQLVQEGRGVKDLLFEAWGLTLNPKVFPFGFANITFFNLLKDAFHTSKMLLEMLYAHPQSGLASHDVHVSKLAGSVLAAHYADIVHSWKQWEWIKSPKNPKKDVIDETTSFLVGALEGSRVKGNEYVSPPSGKEWFKNEFNLRFESPQRTVLREFVSGCLNRAGYLKLTTLEREKRKIRRQYEERRKLARERGEPWEPLITPEEGAVLAIGDERDDAGYVQMTEGDFGFAWDRDGETPKKLRQRVTDRENQHAWGSPEFFTAAFADPLPIKAVLIHDLPSLQSEMERMGRTKTVNGKVRNAAAYFSDVEKELRSIARQFFGLARSR